MSPYPYIACLLFSGLLAATPAGAAPPETPLGRLVESDAQARFARAMSAYEVQHFQEAYASLVQLADEGHAESARIALLMARYGRTLYGQDLVVSERQRLAWSGRLQIARAD